jgi:hypothetical protein
LNYLETYGGVTTRPFHIFPTLAEAREWLADQSMSFRLPTDR